MLQPWEWQPEFLAGSWSLVSLLIELPDYHGERTCKGSCPSSAKCKLRSLAENCQGHLLGYFYTKTPVSARLQNLPDSHQWADVKSFDKWTALAQEALFRGLRVMVGVGTMSDSKIPVLILFLQRAEIFSKNHHFHLSLWPFACKALTCQGWLLILVLSKNFEDSVVLTGSSLWEEVILRESGWKQTELIFYFHSPPGTSTFYH